MNNEETIYNNPNGKYYMVSSNSPKLDYTQKYEVQIDNLKIEYISEWRKGIAIGYSKDNISSYKYIPNLISKNNKILYHGYGCYDYVEEIYRTSKGYYLVYHYKDFSAPGKDPDYRGPFLKCVISENGEEIIYQSDIDKYLYKSLDFKSDWYNPYDKDVFIPKEMGLGIVEYDNSFYQLEDFKKLFEIPHKFKIESIFEQNRCLLSVPEDNRDIIVTVKNNKAIDYTDVDDIEKLTTLIDMTNDSTLIKYSTSKEPTANVIRRMQAIIDMHQADKKAEALCDVNYYSAYTHPRHFISDHPIAINDFDKGIIISKEEIKILQDLHQTVCYEGNFTNYGKYFFHLKEIDIYPDDCLECIFYQDFMVLRMPTGYVSYYQYRFYSLDGRSMSDKIYNKVYSTKDNITIEDDKNFRNFSFHYSNDRKDCGIIIIKDGQLIDNPFPDFMFDKNTGYYNLSVNEHCVIFKNERYDFFFNKIFINYIDVRLDEVIANYLYKMKPEFEYYYVGNQYFVAPNETMYEKHLCLPTHKSLDYVGRELNHKHKNRPNHVEDIIYIGNYNDNDEEYSLYLFKCRPHAYCDTSGHISYDFNPDKIEL